MAKEEKTKTAREVLLGFLNAPLSDADCIRFYVPKGTSRLKGLLMAQIAKAYTGDSRAFEAIMKVAYGDGVPSMEDMPEDGLSTSLRELADELDRRNFD